MKEASVFNLNLNLSIFSYGHYSNEIFEEHSIQISIAFHVTPLMKTLILWVLLEEYAPGSGHQTTYSAHPQLAVKHK